MPTAITCPNQNLPEWKALVKEVGEDLAHLAYQRHGDIPDVATARQLLLPKTDPEGAPPREPASASYSIVAAAPAPDPKVIHDSIQKLLGTDPREEYVASRRDSQNDRRFFADPKRAPWTFRATWTAVADPKLDNATNFTRVLEYLHNYADTSFDPKQFATALEPYFAKRSGVDLNSSDAEAAPYREEDSLQLVSAMEEAFDKTFGEAPAEMVDLAASKASESEQYDDDARIRAVERNDAVRMAAILFRELLPVGSQSWGYIHDRIQEAFRREAKALGRPAGFKPGDLGAWLDQPDSNEPLVERYRRYIKSLVGIKSDGSRDLTPAYNFLASFNGGYGLRSTGISEVGMRDGALSHKLTLNKNTTPVIPLGRLAKSAVRHLSDPKNLESLYHFVLGDGWNETLPSGKVAKRDPVYAPTSTFAARVFSVPAADATGKPVHESSAYLMPLIQQKVSYFETQASLPRPADKTEAEWAARAAIFRDRGSVSYQDRTLRRRMADSLERVFGDQPGLRAAILNEMSIESTSQREPHFSYAANDLNKMLFELGWLAKENLAKPVPNLQQRIEKIVRTNLLENKVGGRDSSNRSNFEILLGSPSGDLTRKGRATAPINAEGRKMSASSFVQPLESRLRGHPELIDHLIKAGYSADEIAEFKATGLYKDGTPAIVAYGGARSIGEAEKGEGGAKPLPKSYQAEPDRMPMSLLSDTLTQAYDHPERGFHPDYAAFWTDQADSSERLLYNLPRGMLPAGDYNAAWDFAENLVNGALAGTRAKDAKIFKGTQGQQPLIGIPGGLSAKVPLAVIMGTVDPVSKQLDQATSKLLDGTLVQHPDIARQERISFGNPEGTLNKTHVLDPNGSMLIKAATQYVEAGAKAPGSPLNELYEGIWKAVGPSEITDMGGLKHGTDLLKYEDVKIGDQVYRIGRMEYDATFKRRTTNLEASTYQHEMSIPAQAITDVLDLEKGEQTFWDSLFAAKAGLAMRDAAGFKPTAAEQAELLTNADQSALTSAVGALGLEGRKFPLMAGDVGQHLMSGTMQDVAPAAHGLHLVARPSGGGAVMGGTAWHGNPDLYVTNTYYYGPDGLVVPLARTNDNTPTSRTGLWLRTGTDIEEFKQLVVDHVRNMRNGNLHEGLAQRKRLLDMTVNSAGESPQDHRVSFDDLVSKDFKFDSAAFYNIEAERPGAADPKHPYLGGSLILDMSRSPGTVMSSHFPARRSEPVAWVRREGNVGRVTPNEFKFNELKAERVEYWGASLANEFVAHPDLIDRAGEDFDGDKRFFMMPYADPKTGVIHRREAAETDVSGNLKADMEKEFKDADKYGTDSQKDMPAFAKARRAYADERISHYKRVLANEMLYNRLAMFTAEAEKLGGKTMLDTRMAPKIDVKPFSHEKWSGGERDYLVPRMRAPGVIDKMSQFFTKIGPEVRAKIDAKLVAEGRGDLLTKLGDLASPAAKWTKVEIPYWLHVQIANGPGAERTQGSAAVRSELNRESNASRSVVVAAFRGVKQVVRSLDARYEIPAEALLDAELKPLFGIARRGEVPKADRDLSSQLLDEWYCSAVNMNIDALKAEMPETAAAALTKAWISLEVPMLESHTFKTREEIVEFHKKFMEWTQGPFGRAYYRTMAEEEQPIKAPMFAKWGKRKGQPLITSSERLQQRMHDEYMKISPEAFEARLAAVKAFTYLRAVSSEIRGIDSIVNAHKSNLGTVEAVARLQDALRPKEKHNVSVARVDLVDAAQARARSLVEKGAEAFEYAPLNLSDGRFGSTLKDSLGRNEMESLGRSSEEVEDASGWVSQAAWNSMKSYASDSLHALAAFAGLPADLRQRFGSAKEAMQLAELAVSKAYLADPSNHLLAFLQTPDAKRQNIKRISGRDYSPVLGKAGLEPYWEAAKTLKPVHVKAGLTLSPKDFQHLLFFYSVAAHGAHLRGTRGGFLRLLSPEIHKEVADRLNRFSLSDTRDVYEGRGSLASTLARSFHSGEFRQLDPDFGIKVLSVPLAYADAFAGLPEPAAKKPQIDTSKPAGAVETAKPRILSPAVSDEGRVSLGVNHAEAYKKLYPDASDKDIADVRSGPKAGFLVEGPLDELARAKGLDEADAERGTVQYFVSREEAMKLAKDSGQVLDEHRNAPELESHMLDPSYSTVESVEREIEREIEGAEFETLGRSRYEAHREEIERQAVAQERNRKPMVERMQGEFAGKAGADGGKAWADRREFYSGRDGKGDKYADPNLIAARRAAQDAKIWDPVLSAPDYETAVKTWDAIKTFPADGKMKAAVRRLMDDTPPVKWEEHRAQQARENPDGPQGTYVRLTEDFAKLEPEEQKRALKQLDVAGGEKVALDNLRKELVLQGVVGANANAFDRAMREPELALYSAVETPDQAPDLALLKADDDLFGVLNTDEKIQAQLPKFTNVQPNLVQKPDPVPSPEEIARHAEVMQDKPAQTPVGAQEDYKPSPAPQGIRDAMGPPGSKADVISGWVHGVPPDWKVESFLDSNRFALGMLDHRMKLEGPRALFNAVEVWSAFAQQGLTSARFTREDIMALLGLTNSEGKLSTYKTMETPEVDVTALTDPAKPLTTGETVEGQATGVMGGFAPWKGAGGKFGQVDQFDKDEQRTMYWVDHALSSWAAGSGHDWIPTAMTVGSTGDYAASAVSTLEKSKTGPNPLPKALADELIARIKGGDTSMLIPTETSKRLSISVPVDLVEKIFMDSSARAKLIKTGRNPEDLTRENLIKIARDHFDRELKRINENVPSLLMGEDAFGTYIDKLRNYVPMKHGTGPIAHAVDRLEKDLDQTLSKAIDKAAQAEEDELVKRMAPDHALVFVPEGAEFREGHDIGTVQSAERARINETTDLNKLRGMLKFKEEKIEAEAAKPAPRAELLEAMRREAQWMRDQMDRIESGAPMAEVKGEKVPRKLTETPTWMLERLHGAWSREDPRVGVFPGRNIFLREVREGKYDKAGLLPKSAGYADVVRGLHDATMRTLVQRKLAAETVDAPLEGMNPIQLARALRTQLKGLPGEEPSFAKARAFKNHEDAWRVAGLLPSSYGFTDLVADYGNRQMATLARKITLNQIMLAEDVDGRPLVMALPNLDFGDEQGVVSDQTWEHAARKWATYFKVPYDESKSGKENAHRIVSANVTGQSSDRFSDRFNRRFQYSVVPTAYGSVSQWYGQQDLPDQANVMDMFVGGEASAALRQLMETQDLWNSNRVMSGVQEINNWMKINALQLSLFHVKALLEDIETATWGKALMPKGLRAKDPSLITLGEWYRMLKTRAPYVRELTSIMDKVSITQSCGNVNPVDIATGKLDRHVDNMKSWLKDSGHERLGDDFKAVADMLSNEQSSFIFEALTNIGKLAVTHSILQRARAEAYKLGRPFDPVKAMMPYNRYVNEAVGGLNPAHYSWATPHARQIMGLGMFSWQWTMGAWNAAGGSLLTGGLLDTKLTPEASRFIFTRRLPAMIGMIMIAEPMAVQLANYMAAAAMGKTGDDDHPWMWDNEEGKKSYADITPMARMMPWWTGAESGKRRLYVRWGKQVHEIMAWLEDPQKTAGGKSSLVVQTAWGLATGKSLGSDWNLGFRNEGLAGWVSGRHGFEDSRLAYLGKNMIPIAGSFSISQVLKNPDAGLIGLTGPTSRGTSYHAACQRAMVVLSAWAEQDHYRTFQYNQKTQANLHALLADVLDDARANGYDPEDVLNASRKAILKAKYADVYASLSDGKINQDKLERASREILRLNGAVEGARSSVRNRNNLYGKPANLTKEQNEALAEAFNEPEAKTRQAVARAAKPKKPKVQDQLAALREYADSLKKKES